MDSWAKDKYYELRPDLRVQHETSSEVEIARNTYEVTVISGEAGGELRGEEGIKALQSVAPEDSALIGEVSEADEMTPGQFKANLRQGEISRDERSAIIRCFNAEMTKTATVYQVYGLKSGGGSGYKKASARVRNIFTE